MSNVRVVQFDTNPIRIEADADKGSKQSEEAVLNPDFGLFYTFCLVFSIFTFAIDIVLHCWLAYCYHIKREIDHFILTVTFIIIPSIVSTGFSMRWYILDEDDELSPAKPSFSKWFLRILTMLLQITQIHRYCDALLYGLRSAVARLKKERIKEDYLYRKMLDEDCDAALLRLFYCVLNSAPQAILQLSVLLTYEIEKHSSELTKYQMYSVLASIISIAWSLTVYHRTVRYIREDKERLSMPGTIVHFLFQCTWTISRIVAIGLLVVLHPSIALLGCVAHTVLMVSWLLIKQDTNHNRCDECVLCCMLGIAYIFVYIASHNGPQRFSYLIYYVICFVENGCCIISWYRHMHLLFSTDKFCGIVMVAAVSFFSSLVFLILYYQCFHPKKKLIQQKVYELNETTDSNTESVPTSRKLNMSNAK